MIMFVIFFDTSNMSENDIIISPKFKVTLGLGLVRGEENTHWLGGKRTNERTHSMQLIKALHLAVFKVMDDIFAFHQKHAC